MQHDILKQWQQQGYLVIKGAVAAEDITRLFRICERSYALWRDTSYHGSEPDYHHYKPDAWSFIHLNNPKYFREAPEDLPFFLDTIAHPTALAALQVLFREPALFSQANYYIDPPSVQFTGGWHRDSQFFAYGDEEKEKADLIAEADPPRELHMHIPLISSAATDVVPGSHLRWDTPEERMIRLRDVYSDAMPGALRLQLEPGDLAFFHTNTIHRGVYTVGVPRRTIAITYSRLSFTRAPSAESMKVRNGYISTYQPWFQNCGYLDGVQPLTREFFQSFVDAYGGHWDPGFSAPELVGEGRHAYYAPSFAAR